MQSINADGSKKAVKQLHLRNSAEFITVYELWFGWMFRWTETMDQNWSLVRLAWLCGFNRNNAAATTHFGLQRGVIGYKEI